MSLQSQFDRLELAKENWQAVLEYHEAPPESTDLFSDYYDYLAGIYFCEIPETVDYGYGYVDGAGWKYEDKGYVANPIDIYKIKKDHEYFILRGADSANATRFRVCTVNEDIRLKTSGTSCMQAINNENAPTTAYATMTKYSNPDYSNAKTPFFKAADDGWLLIQKDNVGTLGLSCYVFDLTTPVPMSGSDSGHTMDESLFDIDSNGVITFKSSVDKSTLSGRKGIPDTVDGITVTGFGDHCFDGTSIAAIEMPSTVTSFGNYAFKGCPFVYFTIPSTVTSIGDYAFENCNLIREITVPATVTTIGVGLFKNCTSLSEAKILGARSTLDETFYNCPICYFNLPSILTVTNGAFYGNTKLVDLSKFPDVVTIGSNAFNGCTGFTSLTIPASVTSIGANAFANCTSLTDINLSVTTPPTLANANAFANTNNCPIYVPYAAVNTYKSASGWSDLSARIFGVSMKGKKSVGGTIFYIDSNSDKTVTFYDSNMQVLNNVSIGDSPAYYSVTDEGTSGKDKYYVYDDTTGMISNKFWGYVNQETGIGGGSSDVGTGKSATQTVLSITDTSSSSIVENSIWTYLTGVQNAGTGVNGCNDWFIGSVYEMYLLGQEVSLSSGVWTSSESFSNNAYTSGIYTGGGVSTYLTRDYVNPITGAQGANVVFIRSF